ncbi:hypothetical protein HMI54_004272 [Coelomomyces lativittatus]|nr:hypothetical protein HMI54_004272 [Coelomomyces lativittatus]KAJ1511770.1 hypothetical protein HMI55_006473 [Coelomomyces lativittatus]KAJ1512060.1 hypothetical protein HMI56_004568 [Coelomomyces lativittatus]
MNFKALIPVLLFLLVSGSIFGNSITSKKKVVPNSRSKKDTIVSSTLSIKHKESENAASRLPFTLNNVNDDSFTMCSTLNDHSNISSFVNIFNDDGNLKFSEASFFLNNSSVLKRSLDSSTSKFDKFRYQLTSIGYSAAANMDNKTAFFFSPWGFYSLISTLKFIPVKNSTVFQGLQRRLSSYNFDSNDKKFKNLMTYFSKFQKYLNSVTVLYHPNPVSEVNESIRCLLNEIGSGFLNNKDAYLKFITKATQGNIKNWPFALKDKKNFIAYNSLSLNISWSNAGRKMKRYFLKFTNKEGKITKTRSILHKLNTTYGNTWNFEACRIPLYMNLPTDTLGNLFETLILHEDLGTKPNVFQGFHVFVIKRKNNNLKFPELWEKVYKRLHTTLTQPLQVLLPPFTLKGGITLPSTSLRIPVQRKQQDDFTGLNASTQFLIEHETQLCSDEAGINTHFRREPAPLHLKGNTFVLDNPFLFVVADSASGIPILVGEVDKVMDKNEYCSVD